MADEDIEKKETTEDTDSEPDTNKLVEEIIEQRKSSSRYLYNNFYGEMAEVYRFVNARTQRHYRQNEKGENEEDTSRTNVCVPDHFIMLRRGTARLTRNPPNLRLRGGPDDDKGQAARDKAAAMLMYQWDRSESQRSFKKIVNQGYGLGWAVGNVYYDEVPVVRRLRRLTKSLQPQDFDNLANSKDPQIASVISMFGDRLKDQKPFTEDEQAIMLTAMGDETQLNKTTIRYRGPVLASEFTGDVYPEAGFSSLNESAYVVVNSMRDADWFEYWQKQTSIDPVTGKEVPVLDKKACAEVMDAAGSRNNTNEGELSLRRMMREAIDVTDPVTSGKPLSNPRKKSMVASRHSIVNGHLCIDFVGEESKYLGRLWYPWETYGRYTLCEMVLIPDWLGGIGMSTLRVTRFLMQLKNTRLNQTTDFINNKLLPLLKVRRGEDLTKYDLVRTGWSRMVELDDMNSLEPHNDPGFPSEAWQDGAQLTQMMQQTDPSTVDFAPGTEDAPGPGKFATTAKLADKAADSVTADTLDQVGMFVRDYCELALWMNQQAMNEPEKVPAKYMDRIRASSIAGGNTPGDPKEITVDPMEMQEDYEVLPEQGSTLAANDEFKVDGLQKLVMLGAQHPDIINMRYALTALVRATPGIDPEQAILPPPPPQPPTPPVKLNINLAIKWDDLAPDVQSAILEHEGLPVELTHVEGVGKVIKHMSEAADHASNLEAPVDHTPQPPQPAKPGGAPPKPKGK